MVNHHRSNHHQPRSGEESKQQQQQQLLEAMESQMYDCLGSKKTKPKLFRRLLLFSLFSCSLIFAPRLLFGSSSFFYSFGAEESDDSKNRLSEPELPCSTVANNSICCDRTSSFRSDVCFMKGDIRTRSSSSSIFLYSPSSGPGNTPAVEKIRPYTRKWEKSVMDTIEELNLVVRRDADDDDLSHTCDVRHTVPAVFLSTGGYTGNVYHEFNDGILPIFITSHNLNKQVVFVVLEYHGWWITKYGDILSRLSDYPPVDFTKDTRTHCFPEATVGLRIHDELAVDAAKMMANKTILDFRNLLEDAYTPRIRYIENEEAKKLSANATTTTQREEEEDEASEEEEPSLMEKPKLVIVSRNGSRGIENEKELVALCKEVGFRVQVLRPDPTTELARIYRALNSSDVMIGVHGAAMTHFLFMRPGSVFIQIVPLGTDWAAQAYYGSPAAKMGLRYVGYKILPKESSLYRKYPRDDPVLRQPESVTAKGWQVTKEVYLDGQNVNLDLNRFLKRLTRAYQFSVSKKGLGWSWNWQQKKKQQLQPERRR